MKFSYIKCDICGNNITRRNIGYKFKSFLVVNPKNKFNMDVCGVCCDKFKEFVKEQLKEQK